ncbi:MAG: hypothetical protein N2D54_10710 [Chloroflexota bacterium]
MFDITNKLNQNLKRFTSDPEIIAKRVKAQLTKGEKLGLVISYIALIGLAYAYYIIDSFPTDFAIYLNVLGGDFTGYFYPYWLLGLIAPFGFIPPFIAYILWGMLNIYGVWYACRVFGGNSFIVLISFQMLFILGVGQIVGIMVFGLAFFWVSLSKGKWQLAGIGLLLASAKIQSGFIVALLLWLIAEIKFKDKLRVLVIPILTLGTSLIAYPAWPVNIIAESQRSSLFTEGNITLWQWIGPWSLLLLFPIFLIPLNKIHRLIALFSAFILISPYFQQADLLTLFIFPIHWLFVLVGNLGDLSTPDNLIWTKLLGLIPFGAYLSVTVPIILSKKTKDEKYV